ncbi:MAG: acyltransferase [Dechloromonas sp.]|nr:acyltransferase [Candidatus Dechloromonas phosphoritropha]
MPLQVANRFQTSDDIMRLIFLSIRKFSSALVRFKSHLITMSVYSGVFFNRQIVLGKRCFFGRGILLKATDGGSIAIGPGTCFGENVQIIARNGRVIIENDVFIGTGSIIVCMENIFIGKDTLIAEYVVIRDQDHSTRTRPIRDAGFITSAIHIGQDVWIGCKATILRGATLGDGCVIGAHALVKSEIPKGVLAVGVPARVTTQLGSVQ